MLLMTKLVLFVQCIFLISPEVNSARILGVFPAPFVSHQIVFRKYVEELVNRGHEVTIITPNPKYPNGGGPANLTEVDVSFSHNELNEYLATASKTNFKRGSIIYFESLEFIYETLVKIFANQLKSPQAKKILEDKNQKFDLIVLEPLLNYHLIVRKFHKAPTILLSSFSGFAETYETMGAVGRHPAIYPNSHRNSFDITSYWNVIKEIINEIKLRNILLRIHDIENELLKATYGPDTPTVDELRNDIDLLMLNSHTLFTNNRPVPPSVIYLGFLHLEPPKSLPQELQSYLDNSKRGVVYVSLGTNVHPSQMDKDLLDAFVQAFEALPYDILWKFDSDSLKGLPKNVKIQKWFPQRDLLFHPNAKLFVTQGGLHSTDEAIDAGVPLVGIPFLGDQFYNVNKFIELGIGAEVDAGTMTAKDLIAAINKVLSDNSYRESIHRLRSIMHDQPESPMERAMWWTEHVLRHGGGQHLRSPAANMPWTQYLMLDLLAPPLAALLLITILLITAVCKATKAIFKTKKVKKS